MISESISKRWRKASFAGVVAGLLLVPAAALAAEGGFRALSGQEAADFEVPDDMELVTAFDLERYGLTYERYQQVFGDAKVLGAQITLHRDETGAVVTVIGAHYPDIAPANVVGLARANANAIADREIGGDGERIVDLMIDPDSERYFYRVETRRVTSRWVLWIDAEDGGVINRFDAIAHQASCDAVSAPCGFGVEYDESSPGDVKSLSGLTRPSGSSRQLANGRLETHDQGSTNRPFFGPIASDADDAWTRLGNVSPAQQALVDTQYYAHLADEYFVDANNGHGFDWLSLSELSTAHIEAHFFKNYNNAFWSGSYFAFGDGDQSSFREFTTLDVVAHEYTHAVTEYTSNLAYQDESGALNESFSDMMATALEQRTTEPGAPAGCGGADFLPLCPDWLIGEDMDLRNDTVPGIRNMADPEEDGDPDHWCERYTGTGDNGGVHTNSGIPNHAFYLLAHGGKNASCDPNSDSRVTRGTAHCAILDQAVTGIGLTAAERIFFLGMTGLTSNATMHDARTATIASASAADAPSVAAAWDAVGVTEAPFDCAGANQAPTANPDSYSVGEGQPLNVVAPGVLNNDSDPDGDSLTAVLLTGPSSGSVTLNGDGGFVYTPNAGFTGNDSFTYKANDGALDSNTATVTIMVNPAGGSVHVGDLDGAGQVKGRNWSATVTITIHDGNHAGVSGAFVEGSWSTGQTSSCTTNGGGACSVSRSGLKDSLVGFTVTNVTSTLGAYDPTPNHDLDGDSNGTSITVLKP